MSNDTVQSIENIETTDSMDGPSYLAVAAIAQQALTTLDEQVRNIRKIRDDAICAAIDPETEQKVSMYAAGKALVLPQQTIRAIRERNKRA